MVSRRDEIRLIGLIGGALLASMLLGPSWILPGGVLGLIGLEMVRRARWIR